MGKAKRKKSMQRTAQKCITESMTEVLDTYWNVLCDQSLKRRIGVAFRLIIKRKKEVKE